MSTKNFHIGDILSAGTGKLLTPRHMEGLYDILGFMTDSEPFTHQLPRLSRECEPSLRAQFPELFAEPIPPIDSMESLGSWLETLYPKYGETLPVAPLEPVDHTDIDPLEELRMKVPGARIIVVDAREVDRDH